MHSMQKDMVTGAICLMALFGFFSGQFILSTVLFGAATILSNIGPRKQMLQ